MEEEIKIEELKVPARKSGAEWWDEYEKSLEARRAAEEERLKKKTAMRNIGEFGRVLGDLTNAAISGGRGTILPHDVKDSYGALDKEGKEIFDRYWSDKYAAMANRKKEEDDAYKTQLDVDKYNNTLRNNMNLHIYQEKQRMARAEEDNRSREFIANIKADAQKNAAYAAAYARSNNKNKPIRWRGLTYNLDEYQVRTLYNLLNPADLTRTTVTNDGYNEKTTVAQQKADIDSVYQDVLKNIGAVKDVETFEKINEIITGKKETFNADILSTYYAAAAMNDTSVDNGTDNTNIMPGVQVE